MTELILPPRPVNAKKAIPLRRCGNCFWHENIPMAPEMVLCQAVPPVPIMIGMQQIPGIPGGQPAINSFWPQVGANQKMCRLWTPPQGPADVEALEPLQ